MLDWYWGKGRRENSGTGYMMFEQCAMMDVLMLIGSEKRKYIDMSALPP